MFRRFVPLLAAGLLAGPAAAHQYELGSLVIGHPWSRPTAAGAPMGVAYLSITNQGTGPDALIGASSPASSGVQFHQTTISEGMARMRPLGEIEIPPGATVKIEPGGFHLMLVALKAPLAAGKSVPLTLQFLRAGSVTVELSIEARDAPPAAETAMSQSLGVVTVVARRPSSLPTQIPTTIEGVSGETVARTVNATDSEDALKYFPSLNVRKRYIGDFDHAVLASRASGTQNSARSLVYADGILLSNLLGNGAAFTPRWGLVTPHEIERVDVLYGPFSAAYPGNSVGAVVDYVTRMPDKLEMYARATTFTSDHELYATDEQYSGWQASASVGDAVGDSAWWLHVQRLDSDGHPLSFVNKPVSAGVPGDAGVAVSGAVPGRNPRDQDWWLLGSTGAVHTVQDHLKAKIAHDFSDDLSLAYTLGWWRNDAARESVSWLRDAAGMPVDTGPVNIDGRTYPLASSEFAPARIALAHLMHGLTVRRRGLGNWDLELGASLYDYARDSVRFPDRIADGQGTGWSTVALRASWQPGDAGEHFVELGLQQEHYRLRSEVTATLPGGAPTQRISAFRGDTRLQSFYAQDSWRFASDWQTTLGVRLEHWRGFDGAISNATGTLSFPARSDTFVSPKVAIAWQTSPDWSLKASLGRAVRMPTVSELYQGSISVNEIIGNDPDLAPEKSWTAELTAIREHDHGSLRATGFYEDTRDALYSQTNVLVTPIVTSIQNVQHIRTHGVELVAELRAHPSLEFSASVTYARSRIVENRNFPASVGKWQPRVPDWRANALATWRPREKWAATLGARYSGRQYNQLDNSDINGFAFTGTSSFLVIDARVRCEFGEAWSAALGVDNLGDRKYWAFHPYTQRTFSAEIATAL